MSDQLNNQIFNKIKELGIDFLDNSNLLENTVKELYVSKLIERIEVNDEKYELFLKDFLNKNGLNNKKIFSEFLTKNNFNTTIFQNKLRRTFKIQKFFLKEYKTLAKDFFLDNKSSYDKVTYSLIRTDNFQIAKELYLQIEANEQNIYDLSEKYSKGDEKFSKGIIGPIPLNQSHKKIIQLINNSKEGELFEPLKIDNYWVILRLEKIYKVNFSNQIEVDICRNLFEKKVLGEVFTIIKMIREFSEGEEK